MRNNMLIFPSNSHKLLCTWGMYHELELSSIGCSFSPSRNSPSSNSPMVRDNGFHSPGWPISNLLFILLHRLLWVTWWYLQTTKNMMRLLHLKLFLNANNNELTYFVSLTWVRFLFGLRISSKLLCGDIDFLWAEPCLVSFGGAR